MYCFFLVGLIPCEPSFSVGGWTFQKLPCQGRRRQSSRLRCLSWSLPQRWGVSFGVLLWKATGFCGKPVSVWFAMFPHILMMYIYIYTYSKLIDSYISIYYVYIYVYIHINLNLLHDTSLHHCQRKTRHFLLKNRSHFYYFPIRNCCGNHHPWTLFEPYLGYVFFSSRFQVDANSQRVCVSCRWMMSLRNITAFSRWGTVVVWGDWLLVVSSIRVLVVFFKKTDTN